MRNRTYQITGTCKLVLGT